MSGVCRAIFSSASSPDSACSMTKDTSSFTSATWTTKSRSVRTTPKRMPNSSSVTKTRSVSIVVPIRFLC
jgi:hypothetical protein